MDIIFINTNRQRHSYEQLLVLFTVHLLFLVESTIIATLLLFGLQFFMHTTSIRQHVV